MSMDESTWSIMLFFGIVALGTTLLGVLMSYLMSRRLATEAAQNAMAGSDQTVICLAPVKVCCRYDVVLEAEEIASNRWHNGESGVRA